MKLSALGKSLLGVGFVAAGATAGVKIATNNGKNPVLGGVIGGLTGAVVAVGTNLGIKSWDNRAAKKAAAKMEATKTEVKTEVKKEVKKEAAETKESFDASHINVMDQMPGETAAAYKLRLQQIIDQADEKLHANDKKTDEKKAS